MDKSRYVPLSQSDITSYPLNSRAVCLPSADLPSVESRHEAIITSGAHGGDGLDGRHGGSAVRYGQHGNCGALGRAAVLVAVPNRSRSLYTYTTRQ